MMNNMVFVPLRGEPSQSRLTPCQLPRKGELSTRKWQLEKLSLRESWRAAPERVCGDKLKCPSVSS